jgi:hypothetical protein
VKVAGSAIILNLMTNPILLNKAKILCDDSDYAATEDCKTFGIGYGRRWSIEYLFNQLKNRWGWKETWQQSQQVLHCWVKISSVSYAIPQLLALLNDAKVAYLASFAPWRQKQPITAGRVRQGLQRFFGHVNIRALWNPKSGKFGPQKGPVEDEHPPGRAKAA